VGMVPSWEQNQEPLSRFGKAERPNERRSLVLPRGEEGVP